MWWTDVKIGGEMDSVLVPSAVIHGLQLWWTDVKIGGEMQNSRKKYLCISDKLKHLKKKGETKCILY
jgi:hypothetical protein